MPTAIDGLTGAGSSLTDAAARAVSGSSLNTDAFLQLLVTQLQNQDPLEPLSNENFLAQLAQFQSLQEQIETAANTRSLLLAQNLGAASALIGKTVTAVSGGYEMTGEVDKVVVLNGEVNLVVDGVAIALDEVIEVEQAEEGEEVD